MLTSNVVSRESVRVCIHAAPGSASRSAGPQLAPGLQTGESGAVLHRSRDQTGGDALIAPRATCAGCAPMARCTPRPKTPARQVREDETELLTLAATDILG